MANGKKDFNRGSKSYDLPSTENRHRRTPIGNKERVGLEDIHPEDIPTEQQAEPLRPVKKSTPTIGLKRPSYSLHPNSAALGANRNYKRSTSNQNEEEDTDLTDSDSDEEAPPRKRKGALTLKRASNSGHPKSYELPSIQTHQSGGARATANEEEDSEEEEEEEEEEEDTDGDEEEDEEEDAGQDMEEDAEEDMEEDAEEHMEEIDSADQGIAPPRRGRGKPKGANKQGSEAEIYKNRIITPAAVRSVFPLFQKELKGAWINWTQYPKKKLRLLYRRWKNYGYKFNCPEEEVFAAFAAHVQKNYNKWMSVIRNDVFKKHKSRAARLANHPSFLTPEVWRKMVGKWLKPGWQESSVQNSINRTKSDLVHTTGSVPMVKYIKEELDRTGVEPSPISCFKRFHVSKPKKGKDEHWPSQKAKDLYGKMVAKKGNAEAVDGEHEAQEDLDEWEIYRDVIGEATDGKIVGLGDAIIPPKDTCMDSSVKTCKNPTCLARDEEVAELKGVVGDLTNKLDKVTNTLDKMSGLLDMVLSQNRTQSAMESLSKENDGNHEDENNEDEDHENLNHEEADNQN